MRVIKIALTGGPAGGKTSVLKAINALVENKEDSDYKNIIYLNDTKIKLITIPETATELISNGITPVEAKSVYDFQNILFAIQKSKESNALQTVKFGYDVDVCLFIYDRGLLDGRAYLNNKDEFNCIVAENDMKELEILDNYDLVIDLLSTATCAPKKYNLGSNKARFEDVEWAKSIDNLTSTAWAGHRNLKLFSSDMPFKDEIEEVIKYIKSYITYGVENNQISYLIENDYDVFSKYTDEFSRRINVTKTYIDFGFTSTMNTALVKRTYKGCTTYFLQVSEKNNRIIKDEKIDEITYEILSNRYDVIKEIEKEELSFVENGHLFKVSFYDDFTTLEVDKDDKRSIMELPEGIKIIEKLDDSLDKLSKSKQKVLKKEKSMII